MIEIMVVEATCNRICDHAERALDAWQRGVLSDADIAEWEHLVARANLLLQRIEMQIAGRLAAP